MKTPTAARPAPRGAVSPLFLLAGLSLVALIGLIYLLPSTVRNTRTDDAAEPELLMFCAAGMRTPIERIVAEYRTEYGVNVRLQYGGSNTLLNQVEVGRMGDVFLAADDSYLEIAAEKGLLAERLPLAQLNLVIGVSAGNPLQIESLSDLWRDDVRVALANPDQAAVGKMTRQVLRESGDWSELETHTRGQGVFKPTVGDVANDVKLGSVDAGILWDAVAKQYAELDTVVVPELADGIGRVGAGVLRCSTHPARALHFVRFLGARDRGLKTFAEGGFQTADGDIWEETPQLTLFAGSVNRGALEPIIKSFEAREGAQITTVYNGCGILTAQMRSIMHDDSGGFPDAYMACDLYYLQPVKELFQDAVQVSSADIVIVVAPGNPKEITSLDDLVRPGVRVALGQPEQCTIGVLSRRLLESAGIYERVLEHNVVTQTATSALLVPSITTGSADAALAYVTDAQAEQDKLDIVRIDSPLAEAIQPFTIARASQHKHLSQRLLQTISQSREKFEAAGFHWQLAE